MKDTLVAEAKPHTSRNVVRMDPAAMASGIRARNDPNTSTSTTRAPAAPNRVSASTPPPPPPSAARASCPVTETDRPPGRLACRATAWMAGSTCG